MSYSEIVQMPVREYIRQIVSIPEFLLETMCIDDVVEEVEYYRERRRNDMLKLVQDFLGIRRWKD
jgi:UDP-glucose 6-dehydrogenase